MTIALDPDMFRTAPLELPALVAGLGFEHLELSPREDVMRFFAHPHHRASSGLRYIMNPPGTAARIHQHLDIGQGEVDWDTFFATLDRLGFDGIMTSCVFAWEDRARESTLFMREQIAKHTSAWAARP